MHPLHSEEEEREGMRLVGVGQVSVGRRGESEDEGGESCKVLICCGHTMHSEEDRCWC